ncbi:hypothetical protein B0H19DRAFT_926198, partial [Mycena capillaripes]
ELARLDAQIDDMQAVLDQLRAKRGALKEEIGAHKALVSPMRFIPQDVLQEIFTSCLPTKHNALIDPRCAPLLLGFICRNWRKVAHSTPRLWSSLHIPLFSGENPMYTPPPSLTFVSTFEGILEAWLDRSGTCPLSISFGNSSHFAPIPTIFLSYSGCLGFPIAYSFSNSIHRLNYSRGLFLSAPINFERWRVF